MPRHLGLLAGLCWPLLATAVDHLDLTVGRVEGVVAGAALDLRGIRASWTPQQAFAVHGRLQAVPALKVPADIDLRCAVLSTAQGVHCRQLQLRVDGGKAAALQLRGDAQWQAPLRWQLRVDAARLALQYSSDDGRVAAEALRLDLRAQLQQTAGGRRAQIRLDLAQGQGYVEPVFVDFTATPLRLDAALAQDRGSASLRLLRSQLNLGELAALQLQGRTTLAAPLAAAEFDARLEVMQLQPAVEQLLKPWLVGTRLQALRASGRAAAQLQWARGAPQRLRLQLEEVGFDGGQLPLRLDGIDGRLAWKQDSAAPPSTLGWRSGSLHAVPLGASELRLQLGGEALALLRPARLPVFDGALRIDTLRLAGLRSGNPAADFDATIEPIDLASLSQAFGWPPFSGKIGGRVPGLKLRDRVLTLDGALRAQAFDGELTIDGVQIVDAFGVLPRVQANIALRRLDLAALTGAFSFGRIDGRLDGDISGLRLLDWMPVAMDARLYTTPGDRSTHRISQKAIDNISAIGGGPTGVLSRGVMRFFDNFAYDRIGWRCRLDNGICHMDGVASTKDGTGYYLVRGERLPRIDVIGYNREVGWSQFVQQLKSVSQANASDVEVR